MPLATNPNAMCTVVLESDKHLPEDKQPKFFYHYLTGLEQMELAQTMDALEDTCQTGRQAFEKVFDQAAIKLVGWTNMRNAKGGMVPFDAKKLAAVIGMTEAQELIQELLSQRPSALDKKKFDSQSASSSAESVKPAKGRANAKTNLQ